MVNKKEKKEIRRLRIQKTKKIFQKIHEKIQQKKTKWNLLPRIQITPKIRLSPPHPQLEHETEQQRSRWTKLMYDPCRRKFRINWSFLPWKNEIIAKKWINRTLKIPLR